MEQAQPQQISQQAPAQNQQQPQNQLNENPQQKIDDTKAELIKLLAKEKICKNSYYVNKMNEKLEIPLSAVFNDRNVRNFQQDQNTVLSALQLIEFVSIDQEKSILTFKFVPLKRLVQVENIKHEVFQELQQFFTQINIPHEQYYMRINQQNQAIMIFQTEQNAAEAVDKISKNQFKETQLEAKQIEENFYEQFTKNIQSQNKQQQQQNQNMAQNQQYMYQQYYNQQQYGMPYDYSQYYYPLYDPSFFQNQVKNQNFYIRKSRDVEGSGNNQNEPQTQQETQGQAQTQQNFNQQPQKQYMQNYQQQYQQNMMQYYQQYYPYQDMYYGSGYNYMQPQQYYQQNYYQQQQQQQPMQQYPQQQQQQQQGQQQQQSADMYHQQNYQQQGGQVNQYYQNQKKNMKIQANNSQQYRAKPIKKQYKYDEIISVLQQKPDVNAIKIAESLTKLEENSVPFIAKNGNPKEFLAKTYLK